MRKFVLLSLLFAAGCSVLPSSNPIGFGEAPAFAILAPASDYVIYSDEATLPSLYMGLNMLTHTKPSFIWLNRATLNTNRLPSHVTPFAGDEDLRTQIAVINAREPNATFTFYMNDVRLAKVQQLFYSQGIAKNRVRVVMLSDGKLTYNQFATAFGSAGALSQWNSKKAALAQKMEQASALASADEFWTGSGTENAFLTGPEAYGNIEFWMQWPELLASDDAGLREHLPQTKGKYYKVDPLAYYANLSQPSQTRFLELVGLDKKWDPGEGGGTLNNQTIGEALDASPRPNIIITGTNPYGVATDGYISRIKAKYGPGYDYFFKGHPGAPGTQPSDPSITVLPFSLPMETIIWAYGDKFAVLGGYESTFYMNAPKGIQKFFFGESDDGSTLVPPLNIMFKQGLLGQVEFIN